MWLIRVCSRHTIGVRGVRLSLWVKPILDSYRLFLTFVFWVMVRIFERLISLSRNLGRKLPHISSRVVLVSCCELRRESGICMYICTDFERNFYIALWEKWEFHIIACIDTRIAETYTLISLYIEACLAYLKLFSHTLEPRFLGV